MRRRRNVGYLVSVDAVVRVSVHTRSPGELLLHPWPQPKVAKADPEIFVSTDLLKCVARGDHPALPGIRLTAPARPGRGWTGWLLHVDADKHLVYKVGTYIADLDAWKAAWPD